MHTRQIREQLLHRAAYIWVEMHRINDIDIRTLGQFGQRFADVREAITEIFAAMASHQQDTALR